MSNQSVIQRMHRLLDSFVAHELRAEDFERAVEFHLDALEFIDFPTVHRARAILGRLVNAHYWEGEEEFGDPEDMAPIVKEFRQFLHELPIAPGL